MKTELLLEDLPSMSITGVRPGAVTVMRGARTSSMVSSTVTSRTTASVFERCGLSNYAARLSISLGAQGARKASVFSLKKAGVLENDGGIDTTTASGWTESCLGKSMKGWTTKDFSERLDGEDGEEAEQ